MQLLADAEVRRQAAAAAAEALQTQQLAIAHAADAAQAALRKQLQSLKSVNHQMVERYRLEQQTAQDQIVELRAQVAEARMAVQDAEGTVSACLLLSSTH